MLTITKQERGNKTAGILIPICLRPGQEAASWDQHTLALSAPREGPSPGVTSGSVPGDRSHHRTDGDTETQRQGHRAVWGPKWRLESGEQPHSDTLSLTQQLPHARVSKCLATIMLKESLLNKQKGLGLRQVSNSESSTPEGNNLHLGTKSSLRLPIYSLRPDTGLDRLSLPLQAADGYIFAPGKKVLVPDRPPIRWAASLN